MKPYCPAESDLIILNFSPQIGHEQSGRRPGVVLSPFPYNQKVGLCLICPITRRKKGYPFEVELPTGLDVEGVILSDQIRSLDWRSRRAQFVDKLPQAYLEDVMAKVRTILP